MKDNKYKYQIVVVLNPKVEEKEKDSLIKKIEAQVEMTGAEIVKKDHAGSKELAYEIEKFTKGDFWIFDLESEKTVKVEDFNIFLNRETKVIRYLILKK